MSKENKKNDNKQIAKKEYSNKTTYSISEKETLDLLDIIELYLCKDCIRI
ncbi:hypothetical protein [Clostridium ihumii]